LICGLETQRCKDARLNNLFIQDHYAFDGGVLVFLDASVASLRRRTMPEVVCELIVSLDGFAKGQRSPGYFGYDGPEFNKWINTNVAAPHRNLVGRRTYELLSDLPTDQRDESWHAMAETPGWLFSRTLETSQWPGLSVIRDDMVQFVRALKSKDGSELRTIGSLSVVHQLLEAGLVDRLKLVVCPLILPQSGAEPSFAGLPDMGFDLVSSEVLDKRVLLLEYRPVGAPPYSS
jgi:dihydrofolate reductase